MEHHISSPANFRAVTGAAEAIQHAAEQRVDASQKRRTRDLGHAAQSHLAIEPTAVEQGLTLYIEESQLHDVAEAALFFTGTSRYDALQARKCLADDTLLALDALKAQVYTPLGPKK